MKQTLCDKCGEPLPNVVLGDESPIYVSVDSEPYDAPWREYHRRCARDLTVAEVWESTGRVPL